MKTIVVKIIFVIVFLSNPYCIFSNSVPDSLTIKSHHKHKSDSIEESKSYYEKGLILFKKNDYYTAEKAFFQAINLAIETNDIKIQAYSYHFLGIIESWKSNFSNSINYHKSACELFKNLDYLKYVAISNNNISTGFYSLGEYDSAIVYFKKNIENLAAKKSENITVTNNSELSIFKKKVKNKDTGSIDNSILNSYQGLATLYAQLYNYKMAYSYLQQGIIYAEETGSSLLLAELYYTAGNLFLNNHVNKDIALEYLQKARVLFAEKDNWPYVNLTNLAIGKVYFKTGNDSLAIRYFKSVIAKVNDKNLSAISQANHMIGMVYKDNNQYDSALVYLQNSIDLMCTVCPEIQIHNTLIEAGKTYLITNNLQQAFLYLNRSRNIAVESNSGLEMVISYEELANYYQTINNMDSSIHYLVMAHKMANDLGLLKRIKSTAETLSKIYYTKKQFQTASDYLKLSNQMNDSLANIERYNELAKLEMRFEIEKREEERKHEAKLMQSEIAKQKLIRNSFLTGAILFILITFLILRAYRRKKKDNRLLAKQKKDIQEISKQLQESGKRKLDFFTNISHEIRTPLTLIKSPLERILNTDKNDQEINSHLQMALNNTNKLKELVNQILDLEKLDEKLLGLDLTEFEIIAFCQNIVTSFKEYSYQSMCRLIFDSNISAAIVSLDQIKLGAIISNLLSNAFKFNKEGGFVKFNLEVNTSFIRLEIIDNGIGISKEYLNKIGERYYRVEQSNTSTEGTGIGLAYVKEIVQLMKGSIDFSSIENKGTSVTITLPGNKIKIKSEIPVSMEIKPKEKVFNELEEQLKDINNNDKPRILIIEDNFELRLFLRDVFSISYHVFCAKDGLEGKEMAFKHIPDLIISDVMMPGIKGNELCKILKNDINTSHITLILFTAKGSPESIVNGYDCGADDYIVKPFETDLLVKKVKNIISTLENARKQFSFTNIEQSTTIYSEFDKKFLKDCMSIIKDNLEKSNFNVEFLAEKMSVHRRTLLRKFNALTGKSPTDLIKHTRMTQAAKLLQRKYRVNEVALMVGYEDTNRFSQAFKQFHGTTPSAYI